MCWFTVLIGIISVIEFLIDLSNSAILDVVILFIGGMLLLTSIPITAELFGGTQKQSPEENADSGTETHLPNETPAEQQENASYQA